MPTYQKNKFMPFFLALFMVVSLALSGCDAVTNQLKADREAHLETQDYKDALAPRIPSIENEDSGAIPPLSPFVSGRASDFEPMPLVSISVNQTVPIRDVLFELARQAGYDIELDPRISGSIIFTARERPFDIVIERISQVAGLRYDIDGKTVRVELDDPYNKLYEISYLSYIRENQSSISNNIAVVSGEGADTGSQFSSTSTSEIDFWGEISANVEQILASESNMGVLRTRLDPRIQAVDQAVDVAPVIAQPEGEGQPTVQVQAPQAVLRVDSLPVDDPNQSNNAQQDEPQQFAFTVNKQAGLLNVFANERAHKKIAQYLDVLKKAVTSQVLIEAKIFEVELRDEYAAGVNWNVVGGLTSELGVTFQSAGGGFGARPSLVPPINNPATNIQVGYIGNDVTAVLDAVSRFGTVHALASPRITVLNNQSAVMTVANNFVYFEIDIETTTTDTSIQTNVDSEIRNVPEGVLINVQPSIDLSDETISLALRPTITSIVSTVEDPGVAFAAAQGNITGVSSAIPVVNVQEIDSVVRMNSGQAIVLGGLLQDRATSSLRGVPIAGELPLVGSLFRNQNDNISKTELVVFLKATILDSGSDSIHTTDKDLYRQFSRDRRPFRM